MAPDPDFTGYATRNGLKCADGRVIMSGAFKGDDGQRVPLVWQHDDDTPANILGYAILENVEDGVRASGFFNGTPSGLNAKALVQHGDITALSIRANQLVQKGSNVHHGKIREVSLVLSGANPGAYIDNVTMQHGDDEITMNDEVIIYTDEVIEHAVAGVAAAKPAPKAPAAKGPMPKPSAADPDPDHDGDNDLFDPKDGGLDPDTATVQQVIDTMTPEQQKVLYGLVASALESAGGPGDSDDDTSSDSDTDATHSDTTAGEDTIEGDEVPRNVFDQSDKATPAGEAGHTLSHADVKGIMQAAVKGGSLKGAVEDYAIAHGIDNIGVMFPEVKLLENQPDFMSRRMAWVNVVLGATRKSPFSRVKTILADITPDEARAKGYITAAMKNEEFFGVTKRTTTPTTIYKKQKLDRDDILDITDFDVIAWMQGEMRVMLDEEVARAILIGDGRDISSQDKIKDPSGASDGAGIRSILNDHEIYTTTLNVNIDDANSSADEIVDAIVAGMRFYRGTGQPTFFTTLPVLTKLLLAKDTLGRRLYPTQQDLASAMMVNDIQTVEPMEEMQSVLGIIVNLTDYNVGSDKGGEVNLFDFFDIDFNQQKYLIETRLSGALVKYRSAIAVLKVAASDVLVDPLTIPTQAGNVVTVPTQTGVTYSAVGAAGAVSISSNAFTLTTSNTPVTVTAAPADGYFFASSAENNWTFQYVA